MNSFFDFLILFLEVSKFGSRTARFGKQPYRTRQLAWMESNVPKLKFWSYCILYILWFIGSNSRRKLAQSSFLLMPLFVNVTPTAWGGSNTTEKNVILLVQYCYYSVFKQHIEGHIFSSIFDASLICLEKQKKDFVRKGNECSLFSYDTCLPNIVNTTKEKDQNKYVTKKERKMTKKPFQCPAQS